MAAQSKLEESTIIHEDSSDFICDCGAQFETHDCYSMHKLYAHTHKSQEQQDMGRGQKQKKRATPHELATQQCTSMEERCKVNRGEGLEGIRKMRRKMRNFKKHKKIPFMLQIQKFANFSRRQQTSEAQQEWNGYTLTKNHACNIEPYFCGSCSTVIADIDQFITHCAQDCQLLVHRKSSHFIEFNKVNQTVQEASMKTEEYENEQEDINNTSEIQEQVNTPQLSLSPSNSQANITGHQQNEEICMEPINEIFQRRLDHRAIPFYCAKCLKKFGSKNGYYLHILKTHRNAISPSSSHIILRGLQNWNRKTVVVCISPVIQWMNEDHKYFCPCKPQQNITMRMLMRHVIEAHHGVSPLYQLSEQNSSNKNLIAPKENNLMQKVKKSQQESFDASSQEDSQEEQGEKKDKYTLIKELSSIEKPFNVSKSICSMIKGQQIEKEEQNEAMLDQENLNFQHIHNIFTYDLDHKNLSPYCGLCKIYFKRGFSYWLHINQAHKQVIDSSCSHIVLRISNQLRNYHIYLTNKVKWITDNEIYYCPCNKQLKMHMNALIKHVFDVHHGVSPKYIQKSSFLQQKAKNKQLHQPNGIIQMKMTIEWNEFKLTKNTYCKEQLFYCGNCQTIFGNIDDFVIHCLDQCQIIYHKDASHFIEFNLKDKQVSKTISNNLLEPSSMLPYKNNQVIPQKQHIDDMEPIKEIIKNNMDHSYLSFYCGLCKRSFNLKLGYFNHVTKIHKGFIQPSSSHIILQSIEQSQRTNLIYLSTSQEWVNSDSKYFCPCNSSNKVTMKQLIQHVMKEHKGISPYYYVGIRIRPKPKQLKQNKTEQFFQKKKDKSFQSIKQEQLNQDIDQSFQSIKQIFYYQLNHKNLPLYCGICQKYFSQGDGYWKHMTSLHNSRIDPSSSHIVLHIHDRYRYYFLYLTNKVKWMHDEELYYCPCDKEQKMAMSSLITHILENHHGVSPIYHQENDDMCSMYVLKNKIKYYQDDPILFIMNRKLDHRNIPFECKLCQQTFTRQSYRYHAKCIHNNKIDSTSSHIILRTIKGDKINLYISPYIEWPIKESIYYCPCNRQQKMTMDLLIMHVFDQHGGISPVYYYYQKARLPKSKRKVWTQANPFQHIIQQNIDHVKLIPFDCKSCKQTFGNNLIYLDHLMDINHNQQNPTQSCSHVIFRTSSSSERKRLYISPRIEWENKRTIYYCPCQPDNKMTMKELLQHHITAHNFITPIYDLSIHQK